MHPNMAKVALETAKLLLADACEQPLTERVFTFTC
jgi:hypothetical protein